MTVPTLLFYMFSTFLLGAAICVVTVRQMVHSLLFLILAFLNAAGLFVLAQAEFLGMILIIVYVGALAILFLSIIMMLDQERASPPVFSRSYRILGFFVGGILLGELIILGLSWTIAPEAFELTLAPYGTETNTEALGKLIYTHYVLIFQIAGLILFIAMMGAIVLTLRHRDLMLKQDVHTQVSRSAIESIRLVDLSNDS